MHPPFFSTSGNDGANVYFPPIPAISVMSAFDPKRTLGEPYIVASAFAAPNFHSRPRIALGAIVHRESRVEGKDNRFRFCLPKTAEISQNPTRAMAYAFIDFFEANAAAIADRPGNEAFVAAMIFKWPCQK